MDEFRSAGKIRFIGLTEAFERDRDHTMLRRALADDCWDVIMVGFNMVNQSARETVFAAAREKDVGILGMFAVRRALASSASFGQALNELRSRGQLASELDVDGLIEDLTNDSHSPRTLSNVAYRYCRDEPAIHSVLMGTGNISHLEQNHATFREPPLAEATRRRIDDSFAHIKDFSGN